jgi:hypothetical protein
MKLPMYISANNQRWSQFQYNRLAQKDFTNFFTKPFNILHAQLSHCVPAQTLQGKQLTEHALENIIHTAI